MEFVWGLTKETINMPLGCLQGGYLGWQIFFELTCWVCDTHPSTLEQERDRAHQFGEPRLPHTPLYTPHPTPYTPSPEPQTLPAGEMGEQTLLALSLHPTLFHCSLHTSHTTPYTLHPAPYTLHPTPYTLSPEPRTLTAGEMGEQTLLALSHRVVTRLDISHTANP